MLESGGQEAIPIPATDHFGPIPTLLVDLSPYCDLACIMCPQGRGERAARRVMDDATVDRVVEGLRAHRPGAEVILPFWNGEPLLPPAFDRFLDRLEAARRAGTRFGSVSIHTHGGGLTPERSERIVRSGLFSPITVSLDAATGETYARIRRGGDLDRVTANLEAFLDARARRRGGPFAVLQFIVMEENLHEAARFVALWRDRFARRGLPCGVIFDDAGAVFDRDLIFVRRLIPDEESPVSLERVARLHARARRSVEGGAGAEDPSRDGDGTLAPSGPAGPAPASPPRPPDPPAAPPARRPCPGIFSHLGVIWDGTVSPCCRDFEGRIALGNLRDTPLPALWTGALLRDHRIAHVQGRFGDVPRCGECPGQPFGAIADREIVAWLKSVGREDLIHPYLRRVGAA